MICKSHISLYWELFLHIGQMCKGGNISHCVCVEWALQVIYTPKRSILVTVWAHSTGLSVPDSNEGSNAFSQEWSVQPDQMISERMWFTCTAFKSVLFSVFTFDLEFGMSLITQLYCQKNLLIIFNMKSPFTQRKILDSSSVVLLASVTSSLLVQYSNILLKQTHSNTVHLQ